MERLLTRPQEKVVAVIDDVFSNGSKAVPEYNAK